MKVHQKYVNGMRAIIILLLFALIIAACGGGPDDTPEPEGEAPSVETEAEPEEEAAVEPAEETEEEAEPAPEAELPDADTLVRTLDPDNLPDGWELPPTVGHVTNYLVHEWYQNETKGEELRAGDYDIDFSINDANLDLQTSLAAVDDYLATDVGALVFTPVNEEASAPTINRAVGTGTPVICEGSPTDGCLTLVSIDDYDAGFQVGVWAGNYAMENLGGEARILDVGLPALSTTVARSDGFVDGIQSVLPDAEVAQSVDGSGLKDVSVTVSADALTAHPDVNIIFGINDDSALGGLQAYTAAGLDTDNLLVVGFGCEGNACKSALMEGGPYKVSAAMFPEYQGRLLIDAAIVAYNGIELPEHIIAPNLPMTAELLPDYYTLEGDTWVPNFVTMAEIPVGGARMPDEAAEAEPAAEAELPDADTLVRTLDPANLPDGWELPPTVGHVTNYLVHEWYQNETKGEEARAGDYDIEFSINDANLDLQTSLAAVDDYLATDVGALVFTPVNEEASAPTINRAVGTGTPVICEGSPTDGCLTLVSIDDYDAGFQVGVWAGNYAMENLGGEARILDVGLPALSTTVARSDGFVDGIQSVLPDAEVAQSVDGSGLKDVSVTVSADALTAHPDVNIIFGINDDSALGGLQAYTAAGLDTDNLLVVGFGCEGNACKSALMEGGPYKVSAAMFPEYQGRLLIDAAIVAYNGIELPEHIIAPNLPMTAELLPDYYTLEGDTWVPNFVTMAQIPVN